jgi:hypothetical protein
MSTWKKKGGEESRIREKKWEQENVKLPISDAQKKKESKTKNNNANT